MTEEVFVLPVSFAQRRLWFLEQMEPGTPAYNMPAAVRLIGELNLAALKRSLDEIVRRHEVLRTTFSDVDGDPMQVIVPDMELKPSFLDLSELHEAERGARVEQLAIEEARQPFDLSQGPLLRASLLRTGQDEHVLLLTMHHIVSDGWSIGVFIREMIVLYEAYSTGEPPLLPELPIQYSDYALWQREWLEGETLQAQLEYWRQQLAGNPPLLELPLDGRRVEAVSFSGAREHKVLDKALVESLKELSRRGGGKLFHDAAGGLQGTVMSPYG